VKGAVAVSAITMLSLNVRGVAGYQKYAPANLMLDVWASLIDRGTRLPDFLLLNELSKRNVGYHDFTNALKDAGYRIFCDPRPEDHENECLIGVGSRIPLPPIKNVEVLYPARASGLDYLAVRCKCLGTDIVILAYRLHQFLNNQEQLEIAEGKLKAMEANYQSIGNVALRELYGLLQSFAPARVLAAGDNNHAAIREFYTGFAQEPASKQRQVSMLAPLGIDYYTPESGVSYFPSKTKIDHVLATKDIAVNNLSYEVLSSPALDHAAITADVDFCLQKRSNGRGITKMNNDLNFDFIKRILPHKGDCVTLSEFYNRFSMEFPQANQHQIAGSLGGATRWGFIRWENHKIRATR
jgi:hypothetical protein